MGAVRVAEVRLPADRRAVARAALDGVEGALLAHPLDLGRTGVRGVELAAAALREQLGGGTLESAKMAGALIVLDVAADDLFARGSDPDRDAAQQVHRLRGCLDAAEFPF